MLLRRRLDNVNKAKGATTLEEVAPMPTHNKEKEKVTEEPKVEVVKEEPKKKANRNDIMRMNVATVRAYAEEQGIEGASAMSGAELKRILVNKLFEEE